MPDMIKMLRRKESLALKEFTVQQKDKSKQNTKCYESVPACHKLHKKVRDIYLILGVRNTVQR